jgi:hypothetical protein
MSKRPEDPDLAEWRRRRFEEGLHRASIEPADITLGARGRAGASGT